MSRLVLRAVLGVAPLGLLCLSTHAGAQVSGTTNRPLPNVLLLVDTSGSMERMPDNSMPATNRDPATGGTLATAPLNQCAPGTASNPNRWGMLLQALTGNMQPYYSCDEVSRTLDRFKNEYKINNNPVYDADYFLPYHRPLTGATQLTACAVTPGYLPGAANGSGVGPAGLGSGLSVDAADFPPDALFHVFNEHIKAQYAGAGTGLTLPANACTFEQAADGQLDAAKDYVRFGLMTFDNDTHPGIGVSLPTPPRGNVLNPGNPFQGQWSYVKDSTNNTPILAPGGNSMLGFGVPGGCSDAIGSSPFEVGARHVAAPPWEGRMVRFPLPDAKLFEIARTNEDIQSVLLGTRPYGATPIDGMLEDARDYFWYSQTGPLGGIVNGVNYNDPYVSTGGCREQYMILLTDGAPNLNLRPSCMSGGPPAGLCPFNKGADVARELAMEPVGSGRRVFTYVIGFSVNGAGNGFLNDGFPGGPPVYRDCKSWYESFGPSTTARTTNMQLACGNPATKPPVGSTADACCQLNEIAFNGTVAHDVGPFFAETQADLVLSFGRILGSVSKSATTRTVPGYAPTVTISTISNTADFVASFIPNARKVWSGEIDRTRQVCAGAEPKPQDQALGQGDSYAANLAAQAVAGRRVFITVQPEQKSNASPAPAPPNVYDAARTIRPYVVGTPDGVARHVGTETLGSTLAAATAFPEVLDIDDNTCKRSKAVTRVTGVTVDVPKLNKADCSEVMWGFATAKFGPIKPSASTYDFNVRCTGTGNLATGQCSISGAVCNLEDADPCPGTSTNTVGEVCVPDCAALGAVYRSSPVIVGPPNQFLREDAYVRFSAARSLRRPTMFVATADGVLHAFKALANQTFDPGDFEMWAFVPPAVLPKLAANYPTGQQILLDGTPAVKDVVWDRRPGDVVTADTYHTTLVGGMGASGGGYYGLNVSDADCSGDTTANTAITNTVACQGARFQPANTLALAGAANGGPHFLWQLTDIEQGVLPDPGKPTRKAHDGTQLVALFGKETATPAITTLQVDPGDGTVRQIGVAILPGGIDGPPVKGGSCLRALNGGTAVTYPVTDYDFSDPGANRRPSVRQWGANCGTSPVPGRGVTIVRLDTGEIIRHFGRTTIDVPKALAARTNDTPFDSPMVGTPVVYPNIIGATAQKIFIGDADGTLWRIDVTNPNPVMWRATLFQDLLHVNLPAPVPGAAESQPIHTAPVISLDPAGAIVVNVATGDQENLIQTTERNYVYSILEGRPTSATTPGRAAVRWFRRFENAQRVTGPMTVFDRTLYFATFTPTVPVAGTCTLGGGPLLWGMDFYTPDPGGADKGGAPRWCKLGSVDPVTGACSVALTQSEDPVPFDGTLAGAIIPGVTIRAAQSCAAFNSNADPALTGLSAQRFELSFGATTNRAGPNPLKTPQAARLSVGRPLPRTTASVDAWALVVD